MKFLNAHKYQEIQHFSGSDRPRMLFSLLINVKMPTIVGILTFMSRKNFIISRVEYEIFFITSEPVWYDDHLKWYYVLYLLCIVHMKFLALLPAVCITAE